ncbi:hypothetical protein CBL_02993 [Carabus blaptoides fortunei]
MAQRLGTYFDCEKFIVNIKEKLWTEVCEIIIPNWTELEATERRMKGNISPAVISGTEDEDPEANQPDQELDNSHNETLTSDKKPEAKRQKKENNLPTKNRCWKYVLQKNYQPEEIDEVKSFLMSLLPSFKKLDDQQKLATKVEFFQVMQKITSQNNQVHSQQNQYTRTFVPSRYIHPLSSLTPSPGPSCSTSLSYISSPDNSAFLSFDNDLP